MHGYEVLRVADVDPADDDGTIDRLVNMAGETGGYLHVEVRRANSPGLDASARAVAIPLDRDGLPLAWQDPAGDGYVDAWNGAYSTLDELMATIPDWIADESERRLAYGDALVTDDGPAVKRP